MAQTVAIVRNTISATLSGTADFTKTGFGTASAAIVIVCNANTTNNPQDVVEMSIGFWDGTNQRVVSSRCGDAASVGDTDRLSNDAYGVAFGVPALPNYHTISPITDGIRLTCSVDNATALRYCTVILIAGISAAAGTFTANPTQNSATASGSLGFAPKLIMFTSIGSGTADTETTHAIISFGVAAIDGTHRAIMWSSVDAAADETATIQYSETRVVGQAFSGALSWSGEVTTFGADTFTMTTRDGGSSSDVLFYLALGGADLSYDLGTLTTPTVTGNSVVSTDVSPDALLLMLSTASGTTLATDSQANGIVIGLTDDDGEFSHNMFVEDGAATMNTGSVAKAAQCLDLDSSASGSRTDLCDATATLNSADFTLNYTVTDGTARKGWWLAFGAAVAGPHIYGLFKPVVLRASR